MKKYNAAPLPFMGQKRRFLKAFKQQLMGFGVGASLTFIDLFGGSGLLARTVKDELPEAKVIYNDHDYFTRRIEAIPATNKLLADLREIVAGVPADQRLPEPVRQKVLDRIKAEPGPLDLVTISSSILFSGKCVYTLEEMAKAVLYNCVRKFDYNADGYLDGLTVTHLDYKELYRQHKDDSSVVYLVDPPYLSTESGHYKNYWKLADYLDVLTILATSRYVYFTSHKSHIIELCSWMGNHQGFENPFEDSTIHTTDNTINKDSSYTDIMVCKL